nr:MAG TPA: hypothetical protein [Caudoviricetes sp.]
MLVDIYIVQVRKCLETAEKCLFRCPSKFRCYMVVHFPFFYGFPIKNFTSV